MLALFIIVLLSYFIFALVFDIKEHYNTSIVGYNSVNIPKYDIPSIFETETSELIKIFHETFKDENIDPLLLEFKEHNPYIIFPFESAIKQLIIDYLTKNINILKNNKLDITGGLNKLYYKDVGSDRLFIFNINLVNNTKLFTISLRVKIKINDIKRFITDSTKSIEYGYIERKEGKEIDYKTDIPIQTIINATQILSIRVDKNNYNIVNYIGLDKLRPNYYQINNVLGLMDPFLTSGSKMILTNEMKENFAKELLKREELLQHKTI